MDTNMRIYAAIILISMLTINHVQSRPDNVDDVLSNKRLLQNYVNCLLDKGKCGPQAQEIKKVLPEALETNCAKCSEKDKENSAHVLKFLYNNEREIFEELEKKFDPSGKFRAQLDN